MTEPPKVQRLSWADWPAQGWLKLDFGCMRECGPASQTFAGLLRTTNKETFASVAKIAGHARLPVKTARKHLETLEQAGYILNKGRVKTRAGAPRRTCTITITGKHLKPDDKQYLMRYGFLPWWSCGSIRNANKVSNRMRPHGNLPWSAKAVFSLVLARYVAIKKLSEEILDDCNYSEMTEAARWEFSLQRICETTGLSKPSVVEAKRVLHQCGIIDWAGVKAEDGGHWKDRLWPNGRFAVVIHPGSKPGRVFVDFDPGKKVGNT